MMCVNNVHAFNFVILVFIARINYKNILQRKFPDLWYNIMFKLATLLASQFINDIPAQRVLLLPEYSHSRVQG